MLLYLVFEESQIHSMKEEEKITDITRSIYSSRFDDVYFARKKSVVPLVQHSLWDFFRLSVVPKIPHPPPFRIASLGQKEGGTWLI